MIITLWQALFLGALQGVAELFPVSSLAQTILIPAILGWNLGKAAREGPDFLAFVVALHLATAVALVIYFHKDWAIVVRGFFRGLATGKPMDDAASKFAWLLIAGTVVVGAFGLVFENKLAHLFDDPDKAWIVAVILIINGFGMLAADVVKRRASAAAKDPLPAPVASGDASETAVARSAAAAVADDESDPAEDPPVEKRRAEDLSLIEGASIGATQTIALLPGISRSGVTIATGLLAGLSYEQATRFSFMLATPIIGAAAALKVPRLLKAHDILGITALSALVAGVCAYLSTRFLMRYFRHNRLSPFGWYCVVFGLFAVIWLRRHG